MILSTLEKLGGKFSQDAQFLSDTIQSLNMPINSKVLDIGTGFGVMAITIALHGYEVTTGEPQKWSEWENYAEQARVRENIQYQQLDAQDLKFDENSFDYIFLLGTLHHIPDKEEAFKEFLRILKENGRIILFVYTDKRVSKIKKHVQHHPPEAKPQQFLDKFPINYEVSIDAKEEIRCYIIKKN